MPIHLERAAQQFVHARDTRAVLEAWRSSLLLRGRVEQRWKSWLAFNGHLLRACMHFWRMPWGGDTRAAFDAWRSSLWLRRRIEQRCKSWLNGRLLAACMLTWRMDRWWCDAQVFNPRGTRVVNPRVANPNESPTLILGGGTTGMMQACDVFPHQFLVSRTRELYTRHAVLNPHDAERH